jgi:hypothetical protein
VVPEQWIINSTGKYINGTLQNGYGYGWWIASPEMYMGLGYRGQYLILHPEQRLVVVFTSSLEDQDFYLPQRLTETYILPAVQNSGRTLAGNPKGNERLESAIKELAAP